MKNKPKERGWTSLREIEDLSELAKTGMSGYAKPKSPKSDIVITQEGRKKWAVAQWNWNRNRPSGYREFKTRSEAFGYGNKLSRKSRR